MHGARCGLIQQLDFPRGWKIGLLSADQLLRARLGSDKQTLASARFEGTAKLCGFDWSYEGNNCAGGNKVGATETQRGSVGGRADSGRAYRPAPYHSLADDYQPAQQDADVCGVNRPTLDSQTFLPEVSPLEVKGVEWEGRPVGDFVESFRGQ